MKHNNAFLTLCQQAMENVSEITIDELLQKRENNTAFTLIDVREDNEWAKGSLPHAIHIGKGVIERDIERIIPDKEQELILYCGGGYRSALACESLQKMGYTHTFSLQGGVRGWKELGHKIVATEENT